MMQTTQIVHCPNCGSEAERHYFTSPDPTYPKCQEHQVTQTECPVCDYLMVMCSLTGNVVEAYAPGKSVQSISRTFERLRNIQAVEKGTTQSQQAAGYEQSFLVHYNTPRLLND